MAHHHAERTPKIDNMPLKTSVLSLLGEAEWGYPKAWEAIGGEAAVEMIADMSVLDTPEEREGYRKAITALETYFSLAAHESNPESAGVLIEPRNKFWDALPYIGHTRQDRH